MFAVLSQRLLAWEEARCSQHYRWQSIWVLQVHKAGENFAHNSSVDPWSYATTSRYDTQGNKPSWGQLVRGAATHSQQRKWHLANTLTSTAMLFVPLLPRTLQCGNCSLVCVIAEQLKVGQSPWKAHWIQASPMINPWPPQELNHCRCHRSFPAKSSCLGGYFRHWCWTDLGIQRYNFASEHLMLCVCTLNLAVVLWLLPGSRQGRKPESQVVRKLFWAMCWFCCFLLPFQGLVSVSDTQAMLGFSSLWQMSFGTSHSWYSEVAVTLTAVCHHILPSSSFQTE